METLHPLIEIADQIRFERTHSDEREIKEAIVLAEHDDQNFRRHAVEIAL
jgi:hypothetical protein